MGYGLFSRKRLLMFGLPVAAAVSAVSLWSTGAMAASPSRPAAAVQAAPRPAAVTVAVAAGGGAPTGNPHANPAAAPAATPASPGVTTKRMGRVHDRVDIRPAGVNAQTTWAVFAINGPRRVIRTEAKAPFTLRLNSRELPNGIYTISTVVYPKVGQPTFGIVILIVLNTPAPRPMATMTTPPTQAPLAPAAAAATPAAAPTAATQPGGGGVNSLPTATFKPHQKF